MSEDYLPFCIKSPQYPVGTDFPSGSVTIGFDVTMKGLPENVRVVRSSGTKELDDAAMVAISKSVFNPGTLDGQPIRSHLEFIFDFCVDDCGDITLITPTPVPTHKR